MVARQWLTVQDVANLLQVRIETVRTWVRRGELPVLELGGARSVYRIRPDDLDLFSGRPLRLRGPGKNVIEAQPPISMDTLPAAMFRANVSQTGHALYVSQEVESLLGYSLSDWRERPGFWIECVLPLDRERVQVELARARGGITVAQ